MSTPPAGSGNDDEHRPTMGPTRLRDLAIIAVATTLISWVLVRYNYGDLPALPLLAGVMLYVVAAVEVVIAFVVRSRVASRDVGVGSGQLHPLTAARVLALAKASALLGAFAVGIWAGLLLFLWGNSQLAAAASDRPPAIIGLIGGVLLCAAALWLEYCCRTPDDPDEDPVGGVHPTPQQG